MELDQKKVNYVDRFARFSLCASESRYPGVGEIKKKEQEFRKTRYTYGNEKSFHKGKKKEQNITYNLKICNVSITRENN